MDEYPQETRIWHTKRPFYIGFLVVCVVLIAGTLISEAARNAYRESEITTIPNPDTEEPSTEDPYASGSEMNDAVDTTPEAFTLHLNESAEVLNISVTPRLVVEDSRCPSDVDCIQAGQVVVEIEVARDETVDTLRITEGEEREVLDRRLTLVNVSPETLSTRLIADGEYEFEFLIAQ